MRVGTRGAEPESGWSQPLGPRRYTTDVFLGDRYCTWLDQEDGCVWSFGFEQCVNIEGDWKGSAGFSVHRFNAADQKEKNKKKS